MKKAVCLLLFLCALFSCASAEKGDFSPRLRAALAADPSTGKRLQEIESRFFDLLRYEVLRTAPEELEEIASAGEQGNVLRTLEGKAKDTVPVVLKWDGKDRKHSDD